MKNIIKISLLMAALMLLGGCGSKDTPSPDPEPQKEVQPETRTLTFVLPEYPVGEGEEVSELFKTQWVAGDQIVVHGEYAKNQVTVTLSASDIDAANPRKATKEVSGLYPYVREDCKSDLYAEWPASAVSNLKHCFFYSCFGPNNAQMLAACNDASNSFAFHNLSSIISFRVDGDYDSYALGARKDVPIGYEFYQVKITDKEQNFRQYLGNSTASVTRDLVADGETDNIYYIPGGADLIAGYTIRMIKDEKIVMHYTIQDPIDLTIGNVLDLGDITDLLEEYDDPIDPDMATDLSVEKGAANCYVVYEAGTYKFPAVKGNGTTLVGAVAETKVLWETWSNDEEVTHKSVIKTSMYDEGYMYFQLAEGFHPGNALLAALDADENVLWSWHIWVPETAFTVNSFGYASGCEIMSRNLGALVDTEPGAMADSRSFGLLYQWGRKDPFLNVQEVGSTEPATFYGTGMTVQEGQITQEQAAAHPTVFASIADGSIDWCSVVNILYWGDQEKSAPKAIYDPCPPGYRAAGRKRAKIFTDAGSSITGWQVNTDYGYFQVGSPVSTLPIPAYLNYNGTYVNDGTAIVWNTHMDADTENISYCQLLEGTNSKKGQKQRAIGASVRCETE